VIDNVMVRQFVLDNFVEKILDDFDKTPVDMDRFTYFKLGDGYQYKVPNDKVIKRLKNEKKLSKG